MILRTAPPAVAVVAGRSSRGWLGRRKGRSSMGRHILDLRKRHVDFGYG